MNQLKTWFVMMVWYMGMMSWTMNTWISIWMIMEISILFLMGILSLSVSYDGSSLMMKYYIIQLVISLIFLFINLFYIFNLFGKSSVSCAVMLFAKLGVFPFHYWIILIVGKMDWMGFFVFSTGFKLSTLSLIYFMFEVSSLGLFIINSVIIGSCLGLNNVILQKLLSYSSLVHLCWLLVSVGLSVNLYVLYFVTYSLTLLLLTLMLKDLNIFYMGQFKFSLIDKFYNFVILFVALSLAGFPPFMGFLLKWLVGSFLIYSNMKFAIFVMVISSVLAVSFYLQLFYFFLLVFSVNFKWYFGLVLSNSIFSISFLVLLFYSCVYFCL